MGQIRSIKSVVGNKMFKKAAFGMILNKDKEILLCHRRDIDFWNLPGGGCGKKESFKNCVLREIKEETGFITKIEKLSGIYIKLKKKEIVFVFVCNITGGKKILSDEADKIEYFDIKKLPLNTIGKHIQRINGLIKKWTFPGGRINKNETPEKAIKREVKEEVGLDVLDLKLLDSFISTAEYKKDKIYVFLAKSNKKDFKIDNIEILEANWFSINNIPELIGPIALKMVDIYKNAN